MIPRFTLAAAFVAFLSHCKPDYNAEEAAAQARWEHRHSWPTQADNEEAEIRNSAGSSGSMTGPGNH